MGYVGNTGNSFGAHLGTRCGHTKPSGPRVGFEHRLGVRHFGAPSRTWGRGPRTLAGCIEACVECAQACDACADATGRVLTRQTEYDAPVSRSHLEACREARGACAEACRRCEQACVTLLAAVKEASAAGLARPNPSHRDVES